jgi:hypothetical protein
VPIRTVLKIRREEPEAFIRYRSTLNQVVQTYVKPGEVLTPKQAAELYHDHIRPELAELRIKAKTSFRAAVRKSVSKVLVSGAALSIGIMGGLLPNELGKLFTAIGGMKVLTDIGDAIAAIQRRPYEIRNDNLYFLLRLASEAELRH